MKCNIQLRKLFVVLMFAAFIGVSLANIESVGTTSSNACSYKWCAIVARAKKQGFKVIDLTKYGVDGCNKTTPIGNNPCMWGPSFWCASPANAARCFKAVADCDQFGGIRSSAKTTSPSPSLVGGNPCTWGPSYWCASEANAVKCGLRVTDCAKYGGIAETTTTSTSPPLVGGNPCTWGPSYWCASEANAIQCGLKVTDCDKYGGIGVVGTQ